MVKINTKKTSKQYKIGQIEKILELIYHLQKKNGRFMDPF